jgi:DNA repair protein RadC
VGLSNAGPFDRRDLAPSATHSTFRDRQALEQLLQYVVPEGAKHAAQGLLDTYGTLARVFAASAELNDQGPIGSFLVTTKEAMLQSLRSELKESSLLTSTEAVVEYLSLALVGAIVEEVRVLFLDSRNFLICDDKVSSGTVNGASIYPREILRRGLETGATALILAHNHPSGDPNPSKEDVDATKRLMRAGKEIGLTVHDHIIVARGGWISLKAENLI